jgi:PAS domain S-box-containing protein
MKRTQFLAKDPQIVESVLSRDKSRQIQACNSAITNSTEIDAVALFGADGAIAAINTVYASGRPIQQARVDQILKTSFGGRDIIKKCVRNDADQGTLEFQTSCDITPAFFGSTGLSVAYSLPICDPRTGAKIGVISSRLRFERLTQLIQHRAIGGTKGSAQFVTDTGGYFSEEINSGKQKPPVSPTVLAGVVLPLVQGSSDYCFTHQGNAYLCLFRLKEFTTLNGGGIQIMVVADEDWLMREIRQDRAFNCGALICTGLFLILCAVFLRSMASLSQSEKWNRLLIECALDSIIAVDEQGMVQTWNPRATVAFGYTSREACGRRLQELILPRGMDEEHCSLAQLALLRPTQAVTGTRVEVRAVRKDLEKITIEIVVVPVRLGRQLWTCIFARDVTEQRLTELHLAQSQKLESIGQLAAGIAHEINTPTQYVGDNTRFVRDCFVRLLAFMDRQYEMSVPTTPPRLWQERAAEVARLRSELDLDFLREEIPKALDQSIEGLNSIAKIVGAMKDFSHPGSQSREPADLNAAIESTTIVCRNRWKLVADLELQLDKNLPRVAVRLGEFNQVILNLIVNAADAISDFKTDAIAARPGFKGRIVVSTRALGKQVEIRVQDNGPGIPPAVAKKIFEPFFTTKPVGKGTGQGLMLSRTVIVKTHGGELRFEPAPGGGTVFIILLPIGDRQSAVREAA